MDALLDPYLRAAHPEIERDCLEQLAATAESIIRRTVNSRLAGRWDDIDDVCSESRIELLLYLRRVKANPAAASIGDFTAYVGTLAKNTCHHYFRRRHAGRTRLKKQISFLLQDADFRSWRRNGLTWCGLASWRDNQPSGVLHDISEIEGGGDLSDLLHRLLEAAGGPMDLDGLVELVARIWRIPADENPNSIDIDTLPSHSPGAEISIDRRRYAQRLWREIQELPRPQRVALLLHLRDGRGSPVISMFPLSGVASFAETAAVLDIDQVKFAGIWSELPWDDNAIARFLSCTRQQVINLRMAARKRLSNRLGDQPR